MDLSPLQLSLLKALAKKEPITVNSFIKSHKVSVRDVLDAFQVLFDKGMVHNGEGFDNLDRWSAMYLSDKVKKNKAIMKELIA